MIEQLSDGYIPPKPVVRPYTEGERAIIDEQQAINKPFNRIVRLAMTMSIDAMRFEEAAQDGGKGAALAASGHFDRLNSASGTFMQAMADREGIDVIDASMAAAEAISRLQQQSQEQPAVVSECAA